MSRIDSATQAWLAEIDDAEWLRETGAAAYGGDLAAWPGRAVDAFKLIQIETQRVENARREAERE